MQHLLSLGLPVAPGSDSCFPPGPLPPAAVHWLGTGHLDRLSASWGAAAGGRDGYTLTLYNVWLGTVAAMTSLGRDTHNFTFMSLSPGYEYSLEASATAGPYQAAAPNISGWTRECLDECPLQRRGQCCTTGQHWGGVRGPDAFGDVHGCNTQLLVHRHTITLMDTRMFSCRLAQVRDDVQGCPHRDIPLAHAAPSPCIQEGLCPL